jgi:PelA/Pel-15E family pectate lyase
MLRDLAPFLAVAFVLTAPLAGGAIVGHHAPVRPLTSAAIDTLPPAAQAPWQQYLARSKKQRVTDIAFLAEELRGAGRTEPAIPEKGGSIPFNQAAEWFASEEARRGADSIVSFQTPAGGWSKNTTMTERPRRLGERFGYETGYDGTLDNDATINQLRFLAKAIAAAPAERSIPWQRAFFRGVEYVLTAQYPNGGWPQGWPLPGDYRDAITFNDGAMVNVMRLLGDLAAGRNECALAPPELRQRAAASLARALECVLATQIVVEGRRTVWCQQHDVLTLAPTSARNFEMIAQSSMESAGLTLFLMELPDPNPAVIAAVHGAAAWLEQTALHDKAFKAANADDGRLLVDAPGAGRLWARFCEIGSNRPLFGDRDKTIHDHVGGISRERRDNYAWFVTEPERALKRYAAWAKKHPLPGK